MKGPLVFIVCLALTFAGLADGCGVGGCGRQTTTYVTVINPKYSVREAVDLTIRDMEERGEAVTEDRVRRRVEGMSAGDVSLPGKKDLNRAIRDGILKYRRQKTLGGDLSQPEPGDYETEREFVEAYVEFKTATEYSEEEWAKRLGGKNIFLHEQRNAAKKLWRAAQKKRKSEK